MLENKKNHKKKKKKMKEIEILLNAIVHVGLSISIFFHIDGKKYSRKCSKLLFIVPMWSMFIGFYYLNSFLFDKEIIGQYWRNFRIFETIGNALFWCLIIFKNHKLKIKNDEKTN